MLLAVAAAAPAQDAAPSADPLRQHYLAANTMLAQGHTPQAVVEFKAFLFEALHRVANAEAQISEVSASEKVFAEALELNDRDVSLLNDYAAMLFDRGRLPDSERLLNSALALDSVNSRAKFLLGRVLFSEEKYLAAKPLLEAAHQNDPTATWFLLGVTNMKLQQLPAAQEIFATALAALGDKAATHFRIGVAYYTGDYPDQAISEFKRAIALDPKAVDQHYYLGLAYLGHNPEAGFSRAEPEFRAELTISPNDFRSHYMLAYIALRQNRLDEAERELARARDLKRDDINTLLLTAELYTNTNREKDAEPLLRKAIALAGSSSLSYEIIRAHYMLGRVLQRTERADAGAKELAISEQLRQQFRAASGATPKERAAATPHASEPAQKRREASPEERARAAAFVHEMSNPIAESFNNLGAIAANNSECPVCVAYFSRAQEWNPSLDGIDRNLGRAAFLCKQYDQAIAALSKYLQGHAADETVRRALGVSLFERGRYGEVVQVLEPMKAALAADPGLTQVYNNSVVKAAEQVKH